MRFKKLWKKSTHILTKRSVKICLLLLLLSSLGALFGLLRSSKAYSVVKVKNLVIEKRAKRIGASLVHNISLKEYNGSLYASEWKPIVFYELYYSTDAWPVVERPRTHDVFRGMCVVPNLTNPNGRDISAPAIFPILNDLKYQGLLCEYGGIFAVANQATLWVNREERKRLGREKTPVYLEPSQWIGFVSWRASRKHLALNEKKLNMLIDRLDSKYYHKNSIFYWGTFAKENRSVDFYTPCIYSHAYGCVTSYSTVFHQIFKSNSSILMRESDQPFSETKISRILVHMPEIKGGWAYCSYFIMTAKNLVEYSRFASAFFVTLESMYNLHDDPSLCPLFTDHWSNRLCWCFIMERLINIWWYHTGKTMYLINRRKMSVKEMLPPRDRNMSKWFRSGHMKGKLRSFKSRLSGKSLELYNKLAFNLA